MVSVMNLSVIGVDPGPTPGIVKLYWDNSQLHVLEIVQCNVLAASSIVDMFVRHAAKEPVFLAVEKFVDGRRSGRGNAPFAARTTRELIGRLTDQFEGWPQAGVVLRSAAEVKPWASDERLQRVGLYAATKGMTHARDAARHALFAAVKLGVPDPMSKLTPVTLDVPVPVEQKGKVNYLIVGGA